MSAIDDHRRVLRDAWLEAGGCLVCRGLGIRCRITVTSEGRVSGAFVDGPCSCDRSPGLDPTLTAVEVAAVYAAEVEARADRELQQRIQQRLATDGPLSQLRQLRRSIDEWLRSGPPTDAGGRYGFEGLVQSALPLTSTSQVVWSPALVVFVDGAQVWPYNQIASCTAGALFGATCMLAAGHGGAHEFPT
jgi:hypothetical protein